MSASKAAKTTADHVALIAISAVLGKESKRPEDFEVIAIGTRPGEPEIWRCARLPLELFKALHGTDRPIFAKYAATAGDPCLPDDDTDNDEDTPGGVAGTSFPNIVLAAAYTFDPRRGPRGPLPLVRLDTIGFVEHEVEPKPGEVSTNQRSSRLCVSLQDPTGKTGVITGFKLIAQFGVAANGHTTVGSSEGDRFDTRAFVILGAEQSVPARSLWSKPAAAGAPDASKSAWFSHAEVGLTLAPWYRPGHHHKVQDRASFSLPKGGWLSDFATKRGHHTGLTGPVPLWAQLGLPQVAKQTVRRQWGLRAGHGPADAPDTLLFRFEMEAKADEFRKAQQTLLQPWVDYVGDFTGSPRVQFAQEQRLGDVSADLVPAAPVTWLLTMRFDPKNNDYDKLAKDFLQKHSRVAEEEVGAGLRHAVDGSPLSGLPWLHEPTGKKVPWHMVGQLREYRAWRRLVRSSGGGASDSSRWARMHVIEPLLTNDFWKPSANKPDLGLTAKAEFRRLRSAKNEALDGALVFDAPRWAKFGATQKSPCTDGPAYQPAVSEVDDFDDVDGGIRVGVRLHTLAAADLEIGAFRLSVEQKTPLTAPTTDAQMLLLRQYRQRSDSRLMFGAEWALQLPVTAIRPAGQDAPPAIAARGPDPSSRLLDDASRSPDAGEPLFFPMIERAKPMSGGNKEGDESTPAYALVLRESVARGRNHELRLALTSAGNDAGNGIESGVVVVVDPEPFRVMAVDYTEPRTALSDQANEVAVWNNRGEGGLSWRVRDNAQTVRLRLPPQAIGEAMEKNRSEDASRPPDIAPRSAAAARFGSPTLLEIDPTYADTDYREPGWNLRRILGYPGQRSPGARLRDLRVELAYGLTTRLVPKSEIWITEIGGTLGVPAEKLANVATPDTELARHIRLANAVIGAERRRLAVEKLWAGRPDAQLKIEDGLSFGLRHRRDETDGGGPATPFRWPVAGQIEPDPATSPAQQARVKATFSLSRDDREAFAGGVPWAFESANILLEVYRQPQSESGRVQDLHLSALGAWANQRAAFAENKSVVDTETTMGRLQRYKLERIGRIGALWHRAKHVIVYERTVVPSRQFYNRGAIGLQQDEHAGRPVLRKVEEYVELLQPLRRYPENGTSVAAAGFLTGVEFKSKRIPVDSRWGDDVRREGWQVPLWNTAFAPSAIDRAEHPNPDDPSLVYPKPQIRCIFAAVGGGETSVEIDDPHKLVFYTSTLNGDRGDNTDVWRPVREVDFVDLPPPVAGKLKPKSEQLTDAMLPAEPEHSPGYERLTVRLAPTKEAVALLNGRSAEGPGATLRNVTIARSAPPSQPSGKTGALMALTQYAADVRAEFDGAVGRALGGLEKLDPRLNGKGQSNPTAVGDAVKAALKEGMQGFVVPDVPRPDLSALVSAMDSGAVNGEPLKGRLKAQADGEISRLAGTATGLVGAATEGTRRPLAAVRGIATAILSGLGALAMLDEDDAIVGYYTLPDENRDEMIETLQGVRGRLWDISGDLQADLGEIGKGVSFDIGRLTREAGAMSEELIGWPKAEIAQVAMELAELAVFLAPANPTMSPAMRAAAEEARAALGPVAQASLERWRQRIESGQGAPALRKLVSAVEWLVTATPVAITQLLKAADGAVVEAPVAVAIQLVSRLASALVSAVDALDGAASAGLRALQAEADTLVAATTRLAQDLVRDLTEVLTEDAVMGPLLEAEGTLSEEVEDGDYAGWAKEAIGVVTKALDDLNTVADGLDRGIAAAEDALKAQIAAAEGRARALVATGIDALYRDAVDGIDALLRELVAKAGLSEALRSAFGFGDPTEVRQQLEAALQDAVDKVIEAAEGGAERLVEDVKAAVYAQAAEATRQIEVRGRQLVGSVQTSVADALGVDPGELASGATRLAQEGADVLHLLRAVGDPPKTDRLGLNRPEVAYILSEANKIIDLTPAVALVNRVSDTIAAAEQAGKAVGDLLEGFGVRLPTGRLAEDLLPDSLRNLSVASLLPDMAGIDFRGLLARAGFPDLDDLEAVKITQGFDKAERRQWLKGVIDVPFAQPVEVLSFGPVNLFVDDARFYSESKLSAGLDGSTQSVKGRITGDWRIVCGGQDIITFRQTGLFFDDSGRLDFKIAPERVELADALEFLTNFLAASGKGGGLVVEPLMRGGVPAGVAATLDLALPDLTLGAFAITSLSLHVMFGVAAIPEFELMGELSVAQRTAPFTLSVWVLNGGGYVTQRLSFRPTARPKPILTYMLDVGIVAGVGIGFNFGVVSGGVWLQIGCSIAITWTTQGGGNTTTITVFILARGNVDVAGLVTASIMLLLEVSYDGARMIGRGTLRLSFKISMFYTLRVNQSVQYVFIGKKKTEPDAYSDSYA
jgi:hypothetical protein